MEQSLLDRLDRFCRIILSRAKSGQWSGQDLTRYYHSCRNYLPLTPETGCGVVFTRDVGHHSSGWWKNPDYERCFHISLSFITIDREPLPRNRVITELIIDRVYDKWQKYIWAEPPYTPRGREHDVWHYRVFCNPAWEPIVPQGEVYNKDFTEIGWLSWSDAQERLRLEQELRCAS